MGKPYSLDLRERVVSYQPPELMTRVPKIAWLSRLERDDFRSLVSGVSEEVGAFGRCDGWQDVSDRVTDGIGSSSGGLSEPVL